MIKTDAIINLIASNRTLLSDWATLSYHLQSLRLSSLEYNLTRVCWEFGLLFDEPTNDEKTSEQLQTEYGLSPAASRWCLDLAHQLAAQLPSTTPPDAQAQSGIDLIDYQTKDQLPLPIIRDTVMEEHFGITNVNCVARKAYQFDEDIFQVQLTGEIAIQPRFDIEIVIFIMLYNERSELLAYDTHTLIKEYQVTPTIIDCELTFPADQKIAKLMIRPNFESWTFALTDKYDK